MSDFKRVKHSGPFKHNKRTVLNKIPFKRLMFKSIFPILNANKRLNKRLRTPLPLVPGVKDFPTCVDGLILSGRNGILFSVRIMHSKYHKNKM